LAHFSGSKNSNISLWEDKTQLWKRAAKENFFKPYLPSSEHTKDLEFQWVRF